MSSAERPKVTAIVPTFNEAANVVECLAGLAWGITVGSPRGSWVLYITPLPAIVAVALSLPLGRSSAKRVELGSSIYLLLSFALAGVLSF